MVFEAALVVGAARDAAGVGAKTVEDRCLSPLSRVRFCPRGRICRAAGTGRKSTKLRCLSSQAISVLSRSRVALDTHDVAGWTKSRWPFTLSGTE